MGDERLLPNRFHVVTTKSVLPHLAMLLPYVVVVVSCTWLASGYSGDVFSEGFSGEELSLLQLKADATRKKTMHSFQGDFGASASNRPRWRLRKGARLNEILVVPKLKLFFCFVPKNACTQFNRLINALNGIDHKWNGDICSPNDPNYKSSMAAMNFTADDLEDALNNPSWTKAVFLRDPLERMVSAFRSKCERRECEHAHDCPVPPFEDGGSTRAFLDVADGLGVISNVHFSPQSSLCGGLGDNIGAYDFVGHISNDYHAVAQQVTEMLELVHRRQAHTGTMQSAFDPQDNKTSFIGLPDTENVPASMLMTRLNPFGKSISSQEAKLLEPVLQYFPQSGPNPADSHITGTRNVSDYFANIFALQKALKAYDDDYGLLPGLKRPSWAQRVKFYYDTVGALESKPSWLSEAL